MSDGGVGHGRRGRIGSSIDAYGGGDATPAGGIASSSSSSNIGKINLRSIENAGYEHLYGIAPVLNALKAGIRDFSRNDGVDDIDDDDDIDNDDDNLYFISFIP